MLLDGYGAQFGECQPYIWVGCVWSWWAHTHACALQTHASTRDEQACKQLPPPHTHTHISSRFANSPNEHTLQFSSPISTVPEICLHVAGTLSNQQTTTPPISKRAKHYQCPPAFKNSIWICGREWQRINWLFPTKTIWGQYHGGQRPSSDDSFPSPAAIPPSAFDKPSIMKRYHHRWTTRWGVTARSPTMVTLHDTRFVKCQWWNDGWTVKTVVTWRRRPPWYRSLMLDPPSSWTICVHPDEHWWCFEGNTKGTPDRPGRAHVGLVKCNNAVLSAK